MDNYFIPIPNYKLSTIKDNTILIMNYENKLRKHNHSHPIKESWAEEQIKARMKKDGLSKYDAAEIIKREKRKLVLELNAQLEALYGDSM